MPIVLYGKRGFPIAGLPHPGLARPFRGQKRPLTRADRARSSTEAITKGQLENSWNPITYKQIYLITLNFGGFGVAYVIYLGVDSHTTAHM